MLPGLTALVLAFHQPDGAVANHWFTCAARFGPYFVSPVIAGLEKDGTPYLAGTDSIGAIETAKDFMLAGTAPESLYGMCESMWRPDMVKLSCLHQRCSADSTCVTPGVWYRVFASTWKPDVVCSQEGKV